MAAGKDQKIALTFVVNGTPVELEANDNQPLQSLLGRALAGAGVAGDADPDKWLLKDEQGNELDRSRKIGDFHFAAGALIFVSLPAGIAG